MEIPPLMAEQYHQAKELIENSSDIKIYSHIDCDGICSGAILSTIVLISFVYKLADGLVVVMYKV